MFVDSYGINASGQVVGRSQRADNGAFHAFLYTGTPGSGGVRYDLEDFFGNPSMVPWASHATAINDRGQIAGAWEDLVGFALHAFLYTGTPGIDGMAHDLGLRCLTRRDDCRSSAG